MLYIAIFIFISRTVYVVYHNRKFSRFNKDISDFLISKNLQLNSTLWEYSFKLPVNLKEVKDCSMFDIVCKPIVDEATTKVSAYVFTWTKKLTNFDILMGYKMSHKKIGSLKLDKGEIRDKNIERLLQ